MLTLKRNTRQWAAVAGLLCSAAGFAQSNPWPQLSNRVGPYSGISTAADAKAAAAGGFNLTVQSTYDPAILSTMQGLGINHIDIQLWTYVHTACNKQIERESAAGQKKHCELSTDEQQSILRDAAARLEKVKSDPAVAGFWILDDYPWGNIRSLLVALHELVAKSNQDTGVNRPTICGVGGSLDHRTAQISRIAADRNYIELSLQNVSPAACDVVAPYFYGAATENDPGWIDWSMSELMPWFLQRLRAQGIDHPALMPVIHAFYANKRGGSTYYVQPRPQDMAAQAKGYCASGDAIAFLFFTWNASDAEHNYANDADIREGVRQGANACRDQGLKIPEVRAHGG